MIYFEGTFSLYSSMYLLLAFPYRFAMYLTPPLIPFSMNWNMSTSAINSNSMLVIFSIALYDNPGLVK